MNYIIKIKKTSKMGRVAAFNQELKTLIDSYEDIAEIETLFKDA